MTNNALMNPHAPSILTVLIEERERMMRGLPFSRAIVDSCEGFLNAAPEEVSTPAT